MRGRLLGGFYLGARTTKGFGRVHLQDIKVDTYDFSNPQDVISWLRPERANAEDHAEFVGNTKKRVYAESDFVIDADFAIAHSLIIRDYDKSARDAASHDETSISAVMKRDSRGNYIIPGTSLKGVLRHRAAYIVRQLGSTGDFDAAEAFVERVMRPSPETMKKHPNEAKKRSDFVVDEALISQGVIEADQSRNRIDRFTGGTIDTALFTTKPIWQKNHGEPVVRLHFGVKDAEEWEAGLALLLLKDLWLGRTAIGGEKSIGRGTLEGISATVSYLGDAWTIQKDKPVDEEAAEFMQEFVSALVEEVRA